MKNHKKIKKIHFVGIKGVGMTPLAIIAKEAGFVVSGSDVEDLFITDPELKKAGIIPFVGFNKNHVLDANLVVASASHGGEENEEVKEAYANNISVLSQGETVALFQKGEILNKKFLGISIAGSHGKTTTTAMIATILSENNLDPSYAIGTGQISSLKSSGHLGKGKYFVAEADEYVVGIGEKANLPKFLLQEPLIIVVTNIDFDHPDVYQSIDEIRASFLEFTKKLPVEGVLICCGDGEENKKFLNGFTGRKITYGLSPNNDYVLEKVSQSPDKMFFWVKGKKTMLGQFSMKIFGEQNAKNAVGAIVVGLEIGLSIDQIKKGLSSFSGTKRRSEFVGNLFKGGLIYDDYAHHPEEIKKTLSAFRKVFPKHKIVTVFQPHTYSRTKKLFNDFSNSFGDSDEIIIVEIFPSFRESVDKNYSSALLANEINKFVKKAKYFTKLEDVVKYLSSQNFEKNTIIITMGAGDVYKIGEELKNG